MTIDGGRVVVRIEGKDVNLAQLIDKIEGKMNSARGTTTRYLQTMDEISPTLRRAEQAKIAYASALARIEAGQGRAARGIQILSQAIREITPNTVAGANAIANLQGQINKYEAQIAAAEQRTKSFATNMASSFNQLIGAAFAVKAVADAFAALINAGNQLEKTDTTVRALAGSQEKYAEVLAIARKQQDLYGGSLQENLDNLSGFIYTANQAGVAVDDLANIARRLAIVDPAQGFKGASIALKEFFSGEITSLARRFEIPRELLNNINELGSEAEKLQALDAVLNKMGLTQELLTSQAETTAVTYDKLTGSFQDLFATIGQATARDLEPFAKELTHVFEIAREGIEAVSNVDTVLAELEGRLVTQSQSYADYAESIDQWNQKLVAGASILERLFIPQFDKMSEAQFAFAQSLKASGLEWDDALARAEAYAKVINLAAISTNIANTAEREGVDIRNAYIDAAVRLSEVLGDGGSRAQQFNAEVERGNISAADATAAMDVLTNSTAAFNAMIEMNTTAQEEARIANEAVTLSIFDENAEIDNAIIKKGVATVATEELAAAEAYLTSLVDGVVAGQLSIGDAAIQMAAQLGVAVAQAEELIGALARLALARKAEATGIKGMPADSAALNNLAAYRKVYAEQQKARAAEKAFNYEQSNTADKLRLKQRELSKYTEDNEQYWKTLGDVKKLEQQLANEEKKGTGGAKGSGGSKAKKSEAQKANEARLKDEKKLREDLLDVEADYAEKMESAEQDHVDNLNDIYEDFYKKQRELQQENEIGKRRSRFDFYEGLDPDSGIDTSVFAAQYEQAFAEAQRIAQEGKTALSQEFLELRQSQIEEMMDLEQQMADIRNDEDLSKGEKQQRLSYLEGLKKLLEDAQREELKQLTEGGDSALAELDARLTDEERRYQEQTQKIGEEARKQADDKVLAAERSREAILLENEALQAQYDLLQDITRAGGTPNTRTTAPLPTVPTTSAPLPVQVQPDPTQATGQAVTQTDLWQTHDVILNSTLLAVGARLETQLVNIITAIDTMRDAITRSVGNVETGISRLAKGNLLTK